MYTYSYCCINNPLLPAFQVNTFLPVSTLALIFDTSTDPALWTGDLWGEAVGDRGRGAVPGLAILLTGANIPGNI